MKIKKTCGVVGLTLFTHSETESGDNAAGIYSVVPSAGRDRVNLL